MTFLMRLIGRCGVLLAVLLFAGFPMASAAYAQAGDGCQPGEVLIGGNCHVLGSKKKVVEDAPADVESQVVENTCPVGEVMIGGSCRVLGKKVAKPVTEEPVAEEPVDDADSNEVAAETCAPGEVLIGGSCRVLGKKKPAKPTVVDDTDQTAEDACPPGEVMIGGSCRTVGKKRPVQPVADDQPDEPEADFGEPVMSWNYIPSVAFGAAGDVSTATLFYGLPETDNVQFSATCSDQVGASQPRLLLSADVSAMTAGVPFPIHFFGSRFNRLFLGTALQGEEAQGGEFDVELDDRLWTELVQQASIDYSVGDNPRQALTLDGIQEPLAGFLADCAVLAETDPGSQPIADAYQLFQFEPAAKKSAAELFGGENFSCDELADRRSIADGSPIETTFENRSGEFRVLFWIDFDGTPIQYVTLDDGQSYSVGTNTAHPWMVTDGPGNCIERFMPTESQIMITRKSPGFGDE